MITMNPVQIWTNKRIDFLRLAGVRPPPFYAGRAAKPLRFKVLDVKSCRTVDEDDQLSYRLLRHMHDMGWRLESGRECQA